MNRFSFKNRSENAKAWYGLAGLLAAIVIHLLGLPKLYHYDGYTAFLDSSHPWPPDGNAHHLIWPFFQFAAYRLFAACGIHSSYAFQILGLALMVLTGFFFYGLLMKESKNVIFSSFAVVYVLLSPQIWFLTSQNLPYPGFFLATVLFLWFWPSQNETLTTPRLVGSGLSLIAATLFHQSAVFFAPAAVLALWIRSDDVPRRRIWLGLLWGLGLGLSLAGLYILGAHIDGVQSEKQFVSWLSDYVQSQHPIQVLWPTSFIKGVMGLSSAVIRSDLFVGYLLGHYSDQKINLFYGSLGLVATILVGRLLLRQPARSRLKELLRTNTRFAVSFLSLGFYAIFVVTWEPSTSHFWAVLLFPMILCWTLLSGGEARHKIGCWVLGLVTVGNIYGNYRHDQMYSIGAPEIVLKVLKENIRPIDIYFVVDRSQPQTVDYFLMDDILSRGSYKPQKAILPDFILKYPKTWPEELERVIRDTYRGGGRVYAQDLVFNKDVYESLYSGSAFSGYSEESYKVFQNASPYSAIMKEFSRYAKVKAPFMLGKDLFLELLQKPDNSRQ